MQFYADWLEDLEKRAKQRIYDNEMSIARMKRLLLKVKDARREFHHGKVPPIYEIMLSIVEDDFKYLKNRE